MVDAPSTLTTRALLITCQQSELLCLPLITCPPPFPSLVSNVSSHHSPSSHSSFSAPNRKVAKAPGTSTEPLLFSLSASNLSAHPIPYRQILVCRLLLARQAPSVAVVALLMTAPRLTGLGQVRRSDFVVRTCSLGLVPPRLGFSFFLHHSASFSDSAPCFAQTRRYEEPRSIEGLHGTTSSSKRIVPSDTNPE